MSGEMDDDEMNEQTMKERMDELMKEGTENMIGCRNSGFVE